MDCRHVWSLPNELATVAHCLRCGETRSLEELLREGMDSAVEIDEQARLLGMSASRELRLLTRIRELEREIERLRKN